ncbi:MAG: hypothetical protein RLZZ450_5659 [Pseudomonadota bacterium]|jgi:uncharacterized protein with NAD-binding domain and iron-sulfur cluster
MVAKGKKIAVLGGGLGAISAAYELTNAADWRTQFESVTIYQIGWRLGGKAASGRNTKEFNRIEEHGLHVVPPNDKVPGSAGALPPPHELMDRAVALLMPQVEAFHANLPAELSDELRARAQPPVLVGSAKEQNLAWLSELDRWLLWLLEVFQTVLCGQWTLRRIAITLNMGVSFLRGYYADVVLHPDLNIHRLDELDLRVWFKNHGAWDETIASAYMRGMYNLAFAKTCGAGSAIVGFSRMVLDYAGAVFWKMQAGMGDTIFGPLYEVLKRRGVEFKFFHRVDELVLSRDGLYIDKVRIGRQVTLPAGVPSYDPLVDVLGLPCWPSEPKYELLEQGGQLQLSGANLEDWWTAWPDAADELVLERGVDFDEVVLGLSVASLPYVARQVMDASPAFQQMVEKVETVQTQAVQLWFDRNLAGLGFPYPSPVLDGYAAPLDTWADMSQLIVREGWPAGSVQNIAYLCSHLDDAEPLPPRSQHGYYERQKARVAVNAQTWLEHSTGPLWPKVTLPSGGLDWSRLVAPRSDITGSARFFTQYHVATANPSDRYVLSSTGTYPYRLRADESGINNLTLAGDWLRTGLSLGCAEGAVMGGLQASQALCGRPLDIVGDQNTGMTRPPYVLRGGNLAMNPSIAMEGTTLYSFVTSANYERLVAMCDRDLNHVPRDGLLYRPLLPMVALVCANVAKSYSLFAQDRVKGWMPERDYSFWVPLVAGRMSGGAFVAERMAWYMPYMFVDNVAAMITGREAYGFHKQTALLQSPAAPGTPGDFSIDTLFIEKYGLDSEGKVGRLCTVRPQVGSGESPHGPSQWADAEAARKVIADELERTLRPADLSGLPLPSWPLVKQALLDMLTGRVPMVFLKQFLDGQIPNRACYQALLEANSRLTAFAGGGLLSSHTVSLTRADSHPIARELGLPTDANDSFVAPLCLWMQMDFNLEPAQVVAGGA